MVYTAWSDGSFMDDGKSYIAYVILDHNKKKIAEMLAEVKGLNTSYEAEFAAMYYLFKKTIELGIREIEIFTDCLTLYTNLRKKKKQSMRYEEDLVKRMSEKMGARNVKHLIKKIVWKRRDHNMAHPLFAKRNTKTMTINFQEEFGRMIRTSKRYRRQNPVEYLNRRKIQMKKQSMEKMCWAGRLTITNKVGTYKIPIVNLSAASKILNTKTQKETLKKLGKKMEKSKIENLGAVTIFRKGRMEITVENGLIANIRVTKRNYADRYKEQGEEIYTVFDLEAIIKKSAKQTEAIALENFDYLINKKAYNAIKKRVGEDKVIDFLQKNIENGILIKEEKAHVFVKGEVHMVVQENTIIHLAFSLSNHSKEWMKRQKLA